MADGSSMRGPQSQRAWLSTVMRKGVHGRVPLYAQRVSGLTRFCEPAAGVAVTCDGVDGKSSPAFGRFPRARQQWHDSAAGLARRSLSRAGGLARLLDSRLYQVLLARSR